MELKDFPQSAPITLEAGRVYESAYANSPPAVSDIVFNNLFGWQEFFGYKYSRHGDFLLTCYLSQNKLIFLPPLMLKGKISDAGWADKFVEMYRFLAGYCAKNNLQLTFQGLPDFYAKSIPAGKFAIIPERNCFDYTYKKDDLANLSGKNYSSKRNLIKQFKRNYQYRYEQLSKSNLYCVYRFIRRWKPKDSFHLTDIASGEYRMVYRLMKNFEKLELCGGVLFVGKKEVAATVGTMVNNFQYEDGIFPTVVVHTEHALVEYKGSYQIINQLFCENLPKEVVYINREEDLGIAGLRKAKMSYYPEKLLKKSRIDGLI